jgi:phage gp45-like
MKTITVMAVAAAIAFSAASFAATPATTKKGQTSGHYCLAYEAGSDCSFTSLEQCKASAAGIGGDCVHQDAVAGAADHAAHK